MPNQSNENALDPSFDAPVADGNKPSQSSEMPPARAEVKMDDTGAALCYANFCRVTGTPEELILDVGLNSQAFGVPTKMTLSSAWS